jgi:hypothetical protein
MKDKIVSTESMIVIMFICVLIINGLWRETQDGVLDQLTHQTGVAAKRIEALERSQALQEKRIEKLKQIACGYCHDTVPGWREVGE